MKNLKQKLNWLLWWIWIWLFSMSLVYAWTVIDSSNIWDRKAVNWDVVTADAWNELVWKVYNNRQRILVWKSLSNPWLSCKDILDKWWSIWDWVYYVKPAWESSAFQVYCDMITDWWGWTLVWKFNRDNAILENLKKWWTNENIATNWICSLTDIKNACSWNLKWELFDDFTEVLSFNMKTWEYSISSSSYSESSLYTSVNYDLREESFGNIFYWKGVNHVYAKTWGNYYKYSATIPWVSGYDNSIASLYADHRRTTFVR
jgi:hypothetical protein